MQENSEDSRRFSNKTSSNIASQLRIDPEILLHQEEWSDLFSQTLENLIETDESLQYNDTEFDQKLYLKNVLEWISYEDRKMLFHVWYKCAINGKVIFFPSSRHELYLYYLSESRYYNMFVDLGILGMIIFSVIESKQCFSKSYSVTNNSLSETISILIFLCVLLQLFDLYLFTRTSHWHNLSVSFFTTKIKNRITIDYTAVWQILRFVGLFAIAINCFIRFKYASIPNYSQIFLLLLIIPRREDLKQLASGILDAIRQLQQIFKIWLFFLILWAFLGFCLLRRYENNNGEEETSGRFSTYWKSLYVCLHCVLSRPTVLYRLKPMFEQNNFIAFYFVFLTIFGDILISALVIAMGTRAFRQFSRLNLNGRLRYRQAALMSIYALYADISTEINVFPPLTSIPSSSNVDDKSNGDNLMSFTQWYNFCIELPHKVHFMNENDIRIIFMIEDKADTGFINQFQFIRLFSIISRKVLFFTGNFQSNPIVYEVTEQTRKNSMANRNVRQKYANDQRFRLNHRPSNPFMSSQPSENSGRKLSMDTPSTLPNVPVQSMDSAYGTPNYIRNRSTDILYFRDSLTDYLVQKTKFGVFYRSLRKMIFRWYYYNLLILNPFYSQSRSTEDNASDRSSNLEDRFSESNSISRLKLKNFQENKYYRVNSFSLFQIFLIILLVIQTSLLSSTRKLIGGLVLGWFLWLLYIIESVVLTAVYKKTKIELKFIWTLNFLQFILYCILSANNINLKETIITLLVILQSIRFVQCLSNFIVFRSFIKIMPVLQRALIFYAIVLYSYAWIGHVTLCGVMDPNDVENQDDDSRSWETFSGLLNFNTIFTSYYTVAASAVLSNWSMIMDAALNSNSNPSLIRWIYLYFFSMRFFTVLILLPLLMSCVIQTYMQYFPMTQSEKKQKENLSDYKNKLSLDYYHLTLKFKDADELAALWSADGKAKVSVVKSTYTGKYGVSIEDLFNQEVLDSLDHQIFASKKSLLNYFEGFSGSNEARKRNFENMIKPRPKLNQEYLLHAFHNKHVMLFQLKDVMIIRKQIKWMKDYHDFEKSCDYSNYQFIDHALLNLSKSQFSYDERGKLASIWFNDGISGFPLIYPTDTFSLKNLSLLHSFEMTSVLYCIAILQMLAVFLTIPQCFASGSAANGAGEPIISLTALSIFDTICCIVYVVDILIDYFGCWKTYATYPWSQVNGKTWLVARVIAIALIFWKSVLTIIDSHSVFQNLRIVRVFFPIIVVARNSNYLDIFYGIQLSMKGTRPVYFLFVFLIFIFGFSGFWLFQRFETHADRFANIPTSLLSILHCSTSAPFSLYVIMPYYDFSQLSPLFFLFISYVAEILCINLIIGTGSVFFNRFGESVLKVRKEKQFNAFVAIFLLLAESNGGEWVTFDQFLLFSKALPSHYFIVPFDKNPKLFAKVLFSLMLYVKKDVLLIPDLQVIDDCDIDEENENNMKKLFMHWKINREEYVQMLFIIFNGVVSDFVNYQQDHVAAKAKPKTQKKDVGPSPKIEMEEIELTTFTSNKEFNQEPSDSNLSDEKSSIVNPLVSTLSMAPISEITNETTSIYDGADVNTKESKALIVKDEIPFAICEISIKNQETSNFTVENFQINSRIHREYLISIIKFCQFLTFQQLVLVKLPPISILDMVSFVAHVLLLIQLCFWTSITLTNYSWLALLYFLETFFIFEMFVRIIAFGELRFFSDSVQIVRGLINFLSFLFMIVMGNDYRNTTNGWYLLVVCLQCLRIILFCTKVRGNGRYRLAIKNTSRSLFLLLLFLYFWTIIAQDLFCGVLESDTVTGSPTNDDDATSWNQFSQILNFNNYQQTLFTLFEVTVLGSWSMIMDAAARQDRNSAIPILFFFFFRLLMALVFLPLLMSFMVRSFIALYDQIAFVTKHKAKVFNMLQQEKQERMEQNQRAKLMSQRFLSETVADPPSLDPRAVSVSERHFYNPNAHIEANSILKMQHDYDDEFETSHKSDMHLEDKNEASESTNVSLSIFEKISRFFHFRPAKPNRFVSSISYVEIWDMLALKETDDNALYNPFENQTLLNLENYRLQMQYYSFLLYFKYKSYKTKLGKELSSTPASLSQLRSQKNQEQDSDDEDDDDPSRFNNQYYQSDTLQNDDFSESDSEDGRSEKKQNISEYIPNQFAEGFFEQRPREMTAREKEDMKLKEKAKKRLSIILDEIKSSERTDVKDFSDPLQRPSSALSVPNPSLREEKKIKQLEQDDFVEYFGNVETLLRVNHSLNQVIHNIFVDYRHDSHHMRKRPAHSLSSRFSMLVKEE